MAGEKCQDLISFSTIMNCVLCGLAVLSLICWHPIFHFILDMKLTVSPKSSFYDYWRKPNDHVKINAYLYNWTNAADFRNHAVKPIVEECGPYSFTEHPSKVNIEWHSVNDSVSYRRRSLYYFDGERSHRSLDDKIIALNVVAMTAASKTKQLPDAQRRIVSLGLDMFDQQRHVIKTVDELLLSGYSDNIIRLASSIPIFGSNVKVPDRFGWFYGSNGSSDVYGSFNTHTGGRGASTRGRLHTWNYVNHTGYFNSNCGIVSGSAGEFYTPNLTPGSTIHLFSPELCRSIPLEYTETVDFDGITGYKYTVGRKYVDNGTIYPENKCYCHGKCHPSGITDVSRCRLEAPLFVSLPHFYQADPYYGNLLDGLQPNKDRHEFYVIVEPKTGATLEAVARLQINILVEPVDDIRLFQNVPRVFFPLIWIESKFRLGPEKVAEIKMMYYAYWSGYIVASVIFAIGLILLLRKYCDVYRRKNKANSAIERKSGMQSNKSNSDWREHTADYTPLNGKTIVYS